VVGSINTNRHAMEGVQALNRNGRALEQSRARIATGPEVSSAKDDGSTFAIATNMRAEVAYWSAVQTSLARGQSILSTAEAGAAAVVDRLMELKERTAFMAGIENPGSRRAMASEMKSLLRQVDVAANTHAFDGVNLINSDGGGLVTALNMVSDAPNQQVWRANIGPGAGTLRLAASVRHGDGISYRVDGTLHFEMPNLPPEIVLELPRPAGSSTVEVGLELVVRPQ
jgi:flagellin